MLQQSPELAHTVTTTRPMPCALFLAGETRYDRIDDSISACESQSNMESYDSNDLKNIIGLFNFFCLPKICCTLKSPDAFRQKPDGQKEATAYLHEFLMLQGTSLNAGEWAKDRRRMKTAATQQELQYF